MSGWKKFFNSVSFRGALQHWVLSTNSAEPFPRSRGSTGRRDCSPSLAPATPEDGGGDTSFQIRGKRGRGQAATRPVFRARCEQTHGPPRHEEHLGAPAPEPDDAARRGGLRGWTWGSSCSCGECTSSIANSLQAMSVGQETWPSSLGSSICSGGRTPEAFASEILKTASVTCFHTTRVIRLGRCYRIESPDQENSSFQAR